MEKDQVLMFHEMGLDDRLLKCIAALGWAKPTLIQEKAIPLALEGKDVLARARTGSGKTAAYCIPVIQKILHAKQTATEQVVKALILTPTKELCNQAFRDINNLCKSCSREVKCVDISGQQTLDAQKPLLVEKPDIVVGTPSKVLAHLLANNLLLKQSMEMLVIDEADLVFSFGYEKDVKKLLSYLPKIYQSFLMSATLSEDVKALKKLVLHNPVILKLEESQLPEASQLAQYHIKCEEEDKFVLLYTLLKLRLVRGKSIVFVNNIDKCYKLKLFLEQFAIGACVLNSELPVNSRCHIVNEFNGGNYDIIIAADEVALEDPQGTKLHKKRRKDKESGISRGIDFQFVSNVVNFDFPPDADAYVHRVGRTARGTNKGSALSFVNLHEMPRLRRVEKTLLEWNPGTENVFQQYNFKMEEIEGFRYRAKDAMRAVTKVAVREARLKEIKHELLNSQKLKSYFEDNPRDLQLLRHDKSLHTVKKQAHLQNVPDYLVPPTLRHMRIGRFRDRRGGAASASQKQRSRFAQSKSKQKYNKRKADPLKSLEFLEPHIKKKK